MWDSLIGSHMVMSNLSADCPEFNSISTSFRNADLLNIERFFDAFRKISEMPVLSFANKAIHYSSPFLFLFRQMKWIAPFWATMGRAIRRIKETQVLFLQMILSCGWHGFVPLHSQHTCTHVQQRLQGIQFSPKLSDCVHLGSPPRRRRKVPALRPLLRHCHGSLDLLWTISSKTNCSLSLLRQACRDLQPSPMTHNEPNGLGSRTFCGTRMHTINQSPDWFDR